MSDFFNALDALLMTPWFVIALVLGAAVSQKETPCKHYQFSPSLPSSAC